jgi:tetratricopeptide (TPR) repeat protein
MTVRTIFLSLLVWLCAHVALAQSAAETKLRGELSAATSDTARARINGALAWELKFTKNAEAWTLANEEKKLANGDPLLLADAYRTMALVRVIENKLTEGLELYRVAIENAQKAKSDFYEASCLSLIAGMYQDMGDYDRSLQFYFDGLKVAERGGNDRMIGTLCNNIATIYGTTGRQSSLGLRYYKRAMECAEKIKNFAFAELIASNMAEEYMHAGKQDSAELLIRTTIEMGKKNSARNYEHAVALTGISDINVQMNKPGDAESYLKDAITIMDSLKRPINVLSPISILCKLYIQQNQIDKAEPLAMRLQKDGLQYHAKAFISEGYKALSDIAHIRKQDALALGYYRQYNAWDDSVFNDTKQQSPKGTRGAVQDQ